MITGKTRKAASIIRGGFFLCLIIVTGCVTKVSIKNTDSIVGQYVTRMPSSGGVFLDLRLYMYENGKALLEIALPNLPVEKIDANWFVGNDQIIVLHYPQKAPVDYLMQDKQGNLHILSKQKTRYSGKWAEYNTLKKY